MAQEKYERNVLRKKKNTMKKIFNDHKEIKYKMNIYKRMLRKEREI